MNSLYFTESDKKMLARLGPELSALFKQGDRVAIKLHMGEVYNPNHIQPEFARKIVRLMSSMGLRPFLFDSPTKYEGPRHTVEGYLKQATELGFTEEGVGCPVAVSDEFVESEGSHMAYQVCRALAEADGVLVLSHFKGHSCTSAGGAIKNLGMGALTAKSKADIHEGAMPLLKGKCILCKRCLDVCPTKCISYEGKPVFDYESCYGCSKCIQNCPQKCLKPKLAEFDTLLADGAASALRVFKKAYFINVLRRITNVCDCSGKKNLHIVCPDIGIVMGSDPCAADRASIDLVNNRSGKDLFAGLWHKSPVKHVEEAEKFGMGSQEYEMADA